MPRNVHSGGIRWYSSASYLTVDCPGGVLRGVAVEGQGWGVLWGRWLSFPRVERRLSGVGAVYGGALVLNGLIQAISVVYGESGIQFLWYN